MRLVNPCVALVTMIALAPALVLADEDREVAELYLETAQSALDRKAWDEAAEKLGKALEKDPGSARAWFLLAQAHEGRRRDHEAVRALRSCKALLDDAGRAQRPEDARLRTAVAKRLSELDTFSAELAQVQRAHVDALLALAQRYREKGWLDDARRALELALATSPTDGRLLREKKELEKAEGLRGGARPPRAEGAKPEAEERPGAWGEWKPVFFDDAWQVDFQEGVDASLWRDGGTQEPTFRASTAVAWTLWPKQPDSYPRELAVRVRVQLANLGPPGQTLAGVWVIAPDGSEDLFLALAAHGKARAYRGMSNSFAEERRLIEEVDLAARGVTWKPEQATELQVEVRGGRALLRVGGVEVIAREAPTLSGRFGLACQGAHSTWTEAAFARPR